MSSFLLLDALRNQEVVANLLHRVIEMLATLIVLSMDHQIIGISSSFLFSKHLVTEILLSLLEFSVVKVVFCPATKAGKNKQLMVMHMILEFVQVAPQWCVIDEITTSCNSPFFPLDTSTFLIYGTSYHQSSNLITQIYSFTCSIQAILYMCFLI